MLSVPPCPESMKPTRKKRFLRKRAWHLPGLALLLAVAPLAALPASPYAAAHTALTQGRADQAVAMLGSIIAANPNDAQARNLLCRVYSAEERDEDAIRECAAAVAESPSTSDYYRWLGRAYGGKAQRSSAFTAISLAKRVRENFQRAVELDPANVAAITDLGEYYVEAPLALAGGQDKARPLLPMLEKLDAAQWHWLSARIAQTSGDPGTAEAEYKLAIGSASSTAVSNGSASSKAQAWADLASFYHKQHRDQDAINAVRTVLAIDTLRDGALVAAAGTLRAIKTEPELTIQMLRSYLASSHKTEEEPAFQVDVVLGGVLRERGDLSGAASQFAAALALAHDYAPAKKAVEQLP